MVFGTPQETYETGARPALFIRPQMVGQTAPMPCRTPLCQSILSIHEIARCVSGSTPDLSEDSVHKILIAITASRFRLLVLSLKPFRVMP